MSDGYRKGEEASRHEMQQGHTYDECKKCGTTDTRSPCLDVANANYRDLERALKAQVETNTLEEFDAAMRKQRPIARGVLDYFPNAIAAVAHASFVGNEQHNPGQPMHWAREKSTDHADCIVRHLIQRGTVDTDGVRHSAKVAWRALAMLELEILKAAGK